MAQLASIDPWPTSLCLNLHCRQPRNQAADRYCTHCGQPLLLGERFRAVKLLGQGGFGRTLLAVDQLAVDQHISLEPLPSSLCVIKQLWPESTGQGRPTQLVSRFEQEARQLAQLGQHPQIPSLITALTTPLGWFLVQDYIPGPTLAQQVEADGPFRELQIRELLDSLLPVLATIHQQQVIHRDIKPANLIQPPAGPVTLVDFGAAKLVAKTALAKTGTVIGSAGYVAPEQAVGQAVFASDLYSLGMTCLTLITGQHPFDLYSLSEDRWDWRPYLTQAVSSGLGQVLDRLVCRALRDRYQTAEQVLTDLAAAPLELIPQASSAPQTADSPPVAFPRWQCRASREAGRLSALAVSPNGRALACGAADGSLTLWDLEALVPIRSLGGWGRGHRGAITALLFSSGGQQLYSASEDGTVTGWDLRRYRRSWRLPHGWEVTALELTPDGETLISGGGEGKIYLWSVQSGRQSPISSLTLSAEAERVTAVACGEDGLLWTGDSTGKLRRWRLPSGRLLDQRAAHSQAVTALVARLGIAISGDCTGALHLWRPDGSYWPLAHHQDSITALALHPSQPLLASGSEDNTVALWQLDLAQPLAVLPHEWGVRGVVFTPDGQTLVTSSADETLRFWQPAP
jgi:hypothetical protein